MQKYLVISYDQNEQQTFLDVFEAENKEVALLSAGEGRGEYAFICEALTVSEVEEILKTMREV